AFALDGSPAPVTIAPGSTLRGSTTEPGEPDHAAGIVFGGGVTIPLGPSVWYAWTAPTTGRVTLEVNAAYDFGKSSAVGTPAAVAVYTGDAVDRLTRVANAGGVVGPPPSSTELRLSFDAAAGTIYRIAAAGNASFPSKLDLALINQAVPGAATVLAGGGNDVVVTGGPGDKVTTGAGNDSIRTGGGRDVIDAGAGNDVIDAGAGDNAVLAGAGNDHVRAGPGNDFVFAADG